MIVYLKNKKILVQKYKIEQLPIEGMSNQTCLIAGKVTKVADGVTAVSVNDYILLPEMSKNSYPGAQMGDKIYIIVDETDVLCVMTA